MARSEMKNGGPHTNARLSRSDRGVTLVEGMAASAVLLIGLIGVIQGIGVASLQNSLANRMTRGAAISHQTGQGLVIAGRVKTNALFT